MKLGNLLRRVATAGLIVPGLAAALFLGPAWLWYGLVALAVAITTQELFSMTHAGDPVAQGIGVVSALAVSAAVYFAAHEPRVLLTTLIAVAMVGVLTPLWRLGDIASAGLRQMAGVAGPLYVGLLLTSVALLRRDLGAEGGAYVTMTLTFAWLGDTGAYFAGSAFGKTKLYAAISPSKTRAGFLGALGGALVGALLARFWYLPSIPLHHAVPLAVIAGGMGQVGDLAESLLKRSSGTKDSGWILPGHGGLLDRLDALMIVGPIVYLYTVWMAPAGGG